MAQKNYTLKVNSSVLCSVDSNKSISREIHDLKKKHLPLSLTEPIFDPPINSKDLNSDFTVNDWSNKAKTQSKSMTMNMKIGTHLDSIEVEYKRKWAYDNLLADLCPFIYTRFLSSNRKYFDDQYIISKGNSKYQYNEIQPLFYRVLNIELQKAIENGLDLTGETDENKILTIFQSSGAELYIEFLQYLKLNGFPVVSCIRLVSVKRQRNEDSHPAILPDVICSSDYNNKVIEQLLQKNQINYSAVESHKVFGCAHFEKLVAYLKSVA